MEKQEFEFELTNKNKKLMEIEMKLDKSLLT